MKRDRSETEFLGLYLELKRATTHKDLEALLLKIYGITKACANKTILGYEFELFTYLLQDVSDKLASLSNTGINNEDNQTLDKTSKNKQKPEYVDKLRQALTKDE